MNKENVQNSFLCRNGISKISREVLKEILSDPEVTFRGSLLMIFWLVKIVLEYR